MTQARLFQPNNTVIDNTTFLQLLEIGTKPAMDHTTETHKELKDYLEKDELRLILSAYFAADKDSMYPALQKDFENKLDEYETKIRLFESFTLMDPEHITSGICKKLKKDLSSPFYRYEHGLSQTEEQIKQLVDNFYNLIIARIDQETARRKTLILSEVIKGYQEDQNRAHENATRQRSCCTIL